MLTRLLQEQERLMPQTLSPLMRRMSLSYPNIQKSPMSLVRLPLSPSMRQEELLSLLPSPPMR